MKIVNEIEEHHLAYWADLKPRRITMKAPDGMDGCDDCAAVGTISVFGEPVIRVAWKPEPGDLVNLIAGGTVWLSTWGGLPPHMLEVQAPPADAAPLIALESIVYDTLVFDGEERGFLYGPAELAECRRESVLIAQALAHESGYCKPCDELDREEHCLRCDCGCKGDTCTHDSGSGIDQTEGPEKVWRCDGCGWLYRVTTEGGISRSVAAS